MDNLYQNNQYHNLNCINLNCDRQMLMNINLNFLTLMNGNVVLDVVYGLKSKSYL